MRSGASTELRPSAIELGPLDTLTEFDLGAAVGAGETAARVVDPWVLSAAEPLATLTAIRLLRQATSYGLRFSWRAEIDASIDTTLLVHLPPPAHAASNDGALAEWRRLHRPGLCYYRLGPEFAFIKDVRSAAAAARFRVGPLRDFHALERIVDVESLEPGARELLDDLENERLVLRLGALATLLPARMRRWPVPSRDV